MPLPIYFSMLNPIERLFSLEKKCWYKNLIHFTEELAEVKTLRKKGLIIMLAIKRICETIVI